MLYWTGKSPVHVEQGKFLTRRRFMCLFVVLSVQGAEAMVAAEVATEQQVCAGYPSPAFQYHSCLRLFAVPTIHHDSA